MRALLPILVVALVAAPAVLAAHSESKRYVAGPETHSVRFGALNVGGVQFMPEAGETSVVVSVVDDVAGPGVAITVCQEAVGSPDASCDPGDLRRDGCSPVKLPGIRADAEVRVWIGTASTAVIGCTSLPATRGNATATFT